MKPPGPPTDNKSLRVSFSLLIFPQELLFSCSASISEHLPTRPGCGFSFCCRPFFFFFFMADKWKRTALLVIDMQKDFVEDDGLMRVNGGKAIVPNVVEAVEVARRRGILVIWVVREHDPLGRDVELFRRHLYLPGKPGPNSKGSWGAELVDGLVIKEGDYKLLKTRFSAFFNTHLHSLLQGAGIDGLVITGVQTPNCIRQTVFDAVALDYRSVTVLVDATAAASPEVHLANIFDMKNVGVTTPTLQEWSKSDA